MELVSKFAESLNEILFDNQQSVDELSKATGISRNRIYEWLSGKSKYVPSVPYIITLADYFKCSIAYLIGLEEENFLPNPKPCPPFSDRFRIAVISKGFSLHKLGKTINMGTGNFYRWISGEREPSLDSLVRIATALDCSIDYLLGRGD